MGLFGKKDCKKLCPLLNKECIEHECMLWTKLIGEDPQSKKSYDQWSCAFVWLPVMMVENSQMSRQTGAITQQFRSEVHGAAKALGEESVRRREIEERRLEMDERLLEFSKKQILLKSGDEENGED